MNSLDAQSALHIIRAEQERPHSTTLHTLNEAINVLVSTTAHTYSRQSEAYQQARSSQPWQEDERMMKLMLDAVRSRIASGLLPRPHGSKWKLLDIGAGYGRDVLRFTQEPDIAPSALENAHGFVLALRQLQVQGAIAEGAVIEADMRDMSPIASQSFECVRNHATLHHLPLLGDGLGADAAVRECRRVLMPGGIFYVLVKSGTSVDIIDTNEGLGGRFFQLFTITSLRALLERQAFDVILMEELLEPRGASHIPWLFALAS